MSHYDPGEIRTETANRPTPPEQKERQEIGEFNQKRLGNSKASPDIYLLFEFPNRFDLRNF
jgi:hypothetical protein